MWSISKLPEHAKHQDIAMVILNFDDRILFSYRIYILFYLFFCGTFIIPRNHQNVCQMWVINRSYHWTIIGMILDISYLTLRTWLLILDSRFYLVLTTSSIIETRLQVNYNRLHDTLKVETIVCDLNEYFCYTEKVYIITHKPHTLTMLIYKNKIC